ncbi:MAG: dihydropteroate synthase [Deltaproteobacteria bacterium]|nr:dihydropteroate synthase [Deltaproteobacteria bacterium]
MENWRLSFRRKKYDLSQRTLIMAALNVTPDSFSDGGLFFTQEKAVEQGLRLAAAGADILDVGGESTRPGARALAEEEEIRRVIPVIRDLRAKIDIPISVDTRKARVAESALGEGAEIINDITALRFDARMAPLVAASQAYIVLMHMQGQPENMQANPHYKDLLGEMMDFFQERMDFARRQGIPRERTILDPGLGFGKSLEQEHNLVILRNLARFQTLGRPLLVGPSRKSFIGKILGQPSSEREEGTMGAVAVAIMNGASIVRGHEVERMRRIIQAATNGRGEPENWVNCSEPTAFAE